MRPPSVAACSGLLILAACAGSTGIVPVGPGTYLVSELRAPALGGGAAAQQAVLAEADLFCRQQGRTVLTISLLPNGDPYTPFYPTAFDHTFRCVSPQAR